MKMKTIDEIVEDMKKIEQAKNPNQDLATVIRNATQEIDRQIEELHNFRKRIW